MRGNNCVLYYLHEVGQLALALLHDHVLETHAVAALRAQDTRLVIRQSK